MYKPITIHITDDHILIIEGITKLLQQEPGMAIIAKSTTAKDCLAYYDQYKSNILLLDINLPDMSGIELCKILSAKQPKLKIIALTTYNEGSYIEAMIANGAKGFLHKNADKSEIIQAIHYVHNGGVYLNESTKKLLQAFEEKQQNTIKLTRREKEIAILISQGNTNQQIADALFISMDTVHTHRKNIYTKLRINSVAQLTKLVVDNELM